MAGMSEVLRLDRMIESTPWGFRLTGGYDFGAPLSVVKVTGGSIAALAGVKVGDIVLEINGQSTKHFIHKDAQNFIGISGNHLTLTILRGSLVTPPVTPLRGRTPLHENDVEVNHDHFNAHILNDRLKSTATDSDEDDEHEGYDKQDKPIVHENTGVKAEITSNRTKEGEILNPNVTDTELDELLTGNEEVLDEGLLGINFKKFMPQVDFIRQSEVFKFLQNENTKKVIPEEVQLEKEPTKRFSTFLQKPKPPPPGPKGPLWHYPKAPRYLPREERKEPELPRRRVKRDSCHTVLWLFLEESGEHVVDERWGSADEERINLSRCEMREEDTVSLTSSITTGPSGRDSRQEKLDELASTVQTNEQSDVKLNETETNVDQIEKEQHVTAEITESESKMDVKENEELSEGQSCKIESTTELIQSDENYVQEENDETKESSSMHVEKEVFSKQLSDIQAQIAALEVHAPSDLQTQLVAIQDQLSKIVTVKSAHVTKHQKAKTDERIEKSEYYKDEKTKVEEEEKCLEELSEHYYEYTFECEANINGEKNSSDESDSLVRRSGYVSDSESGRNDSGSVNGESENNMNEGNDEYIRGYQKGEYEICETPVPSTQAKKAPAHPITPQMRPIVLPGGRMWRQPKDACHDDFYQGVLVAQAEVMIGNTGGVNFTKYVPPKFDMSHSAVYKLVHEIEDKTRRNNEQEEAYYHTPIGKRHFYAATLKEPDPIGGVDL